MRTVRYAIVRTLTAATALTEQHAELRRPGDHRIGDSVVGGQQEPERDDQLADPHRPVLLIAGVRRVSPR